MFDAAGKRTRIERTELEQGFAVALDRFERAVSGPLVRSVPPETRDFLRLLAEPGGLSNAAAAARALGLTPAQAGERVATLQGAGILDRDHHGKASFTHPYLDRTIRDLVPDPRGHDPLRALMAAPALGQERVSEPPHEGMHRRPERGRDAWSGRVHSPGR